MSTQSLDQDTITAAVRLACRAPSVHNTQPWRWRAAPHSLHLFADRSRWLSATDPEGRDLLLSCGAALHHLRVALAGLGWATRVHRLPNPAEPDHLAAVEFSPRAPSADDIALAGAIPHRRTDRRRFSSWPVPPELLEVLVRAAAERGGVLLPVTDALDRFRLVIAAAEAANRQPQVPGYVDELAEWTARGPGAVEGVPAANLPVADLAGAAQRHGDTTMRAFPPGRLVDSPSLGEPDGGALLVLGTSSDDEVSRLRAGEAMSAVLLTATASWLASCPLSQPLEVATTRELVRERVLDGAASPQVVLRVGWAPTENPPVPATPRRAVSDVLDHYPE